MFGRAAMSDGEQEVAAHRPFWGLLGSLVAVMVFAPSISDEGNLSILIDLLFASTILFALLTVSHSLFKSVVAGVLALVLFGANLAASYATESSWVEALTMLAGIGYFSWALVVVLDDVFFTDRVESHTIVGSVCAYLLIGLLWGFAYGFLDVMVPGSFSGALDETNLVTRFVYFSYVTLTTLGFGDITPVKPLAMSLVTLEAIVGQLFLTILVARLVGLHLAQRRDDE